VVDISSICFGVSQKCWRAVVVVEILASVAVNFSLCTNCAPRQDGQATPFIAGLLRHIHLSLFHTHLCIKHVNVFQNLSQSYRYLNSFAFSCWFNAIILTKFTTSSSDKELHDFVSSVVDCASASNDIKTDRQITVNTGVKLAA